MLLLADHLTGRRRRAGADPLITYYDPHAAERTELSGVTFANWADKAANFFVDELGLAPGERLGVPLLTEHPGHWMSLAVAMGAWQCGLELSPDADAAEAWIVGPEQTGSPRRPLAACALHPLGLGFATGLPDGVLDFAAEVRAQPDAWFGEPAAADGAAWSEAGHTLTQAELVGQPERAAAGRRLVRPTTAWATLREALITPIVTGGSVVVVAGDVGAEELAAIAAAERVA